MHRNKAGKDNVVIYHGICRAINGYEVGTDEKPVSIMISREQFDELLDEVKDDPYVVMLADPNGSGMISGVMIDGVKIECAQP